MVEVRVSPEQISHVVVVSKKVSETEWLNPSGLGLMVTPLLSTDTKLLSELTGPLVSNVVLPSVQSSCTMGVNGFRSPVRDPAISVTKLQGLASRPTYSDSS